MKAILKFVQCSAERKSTSDQFEDDLIYRMSNLIRDHLSIAEIQNLESFLRGLNETDFFLLVSGKYEDVLQPTNFQHLVFASHLKFFFKQL